MKSPQFFPDNLIITAKALQRITMISLLMWLQANLFSQTLTFSVSGTPCINGSAVAGVVGTNSNAAFYTWSGFPAVSTSTVNFANTQMNILFSSCGIHTITCFAYNSASSLIATSSSTINVSCAGLTLTPASQTICTGATASITASGASSYIWSTGATTGSITSTPLSNSNYTVSGNTGCSATASVTIFNLTVTASAASLCPLSQLTLTSIGGSSYSWLQPPGTQFASTSNTSVVTSPSVLPITYTVVGLYGTSCISAKTISVGLFPFTAKATSPASVCSGVTSSLVGAQANTYTWASPFQTVTANPFVFSQTLATTYTLTADSLNCKNTRTINVGMHPTPVLTMSASSGIICPNQLVGLFVNGAINYTWVTHPSLLSSLFGGSVSAGPLSTTVYSVSGTNTVGCRGFSTYTVTVNVFPSLLATSGSSALCAGFTTTLAAFGANTYVWTSSNFTNQISTSTLSGVAGTYSVLGSNGGTCRDSAFVTILLTPPLNIVTAQSSSATCIKIDGQIDPVNLTASGATNYSWAPFTPGLMTYSLGPNTSVTPTVSTCYTVTGSTSDCTGKAVLCVVSGYCSGFSDVRAEERFNLFPNPAGELLFLKLHSAGTFTLTVLNAQGDVLQVERFENKSDQIREISLKEYSAGIYSLLINSAQDGMHAVKLVKE
ncbi:MAG: T9SS type A sorting domain-containing protein [bacterium]|nr:T9SS type A sorting domain-containing protein [bacterium]